MNILDELLTMLKSRVRMFERESKTALTAELRLIYRTKATEASAIYAEIYNIKRKKLKGGTE